MAELVKIFIDPGHGGNDSGAARNGLKEKDLTLTISKKIRDILANEYTGVAVRMSRSGDTFPTLKQRTDDANGWGAHFFLSIHINSGGGTGFETFTYPGTTKKYQEHIHAEIMKVIGLKDRGMKQDNFHVIRESKMPAILTESGFIDSLNDSVKMKDSAWINNVARSHVTGLEKALNLNKKVVAQPKQEVVQVAQRDINVVSDWASENWKEACENGYFDGTRPGASITREEDAIVVNRIIDNIREYITDPLEKRIESLEKENKQLKEKVQSLELDVK